MLKIQEHFTTAGKGNRLLNRTSTHRKQSIELTKVIANGIKWNQKGFCTAKETIDWWTEFTEWEKIFTNYPPHKKLTSRLYEEEGKTCPLCPPYHPVFPTTIRFEQREESRINPNWEGGTPPPPERVYSPPSAILHPNTWDFCCSSPDKERKKGKKNTNSQ